MPLTQERLTKIRRAVLSSDPRGVPLFEELLTAYNEQRATIQAVTALRDELKRYPRDDTHAAVWELNEILDGHQ